MTLTKSNSAKLAAGFVGFAMAMSAFVPAIASAQSTSDLQAQINSLLATIASLQAQLAGSSTGGSTTSTGYTFNTNLMLGSKGTDVMNLQKVLNMSADTKVAATGAGSPGSETSTFGPATKAAVIKFQNKYGITPAAGYVGPVTRAKLNSMNTGIGTGTGTGTGTNPQGGSLSVSAGSQPANGLVTEGAARVPFTTVVLTAGTSDVTVNSLTVERVGLMQNAVVSGVVLLKSDGTQIGIAKTLNSNNQAMVGEPWVIKAGTSQTVTVAGNMPAGATALDAYAGQVGGLNVVAVNTSASVAGSLPVMGAMHTVNATLTIGTATVQISSFDPGSAQTKEIGTTNYKFAGVRVTAGSAEQVRLWSVRWNQTGSAASGDLSNVKVYVDGTAYDTTVSADGKYYSANFPGGILIDKGVSKDVYIQGDISGSGASGRTIDFDIYRNTDVYVSGVTYNYGITPTGSGTGFSGGTPWYNGSVVTVSGGSVTTIQKATSVAAQNIAVNVPNQVLGGFTTDIKGEPISVQSMVFTVASSSGSGSGPLTNVTIVDSNGAVVAGPVDATTAGVLTFTDTVTFPVGAKTYTLKGKVASTIGNGTIYTLSSNPSATGGLGWSNVTGQTTGNTLTLSNGSFSMNSMTVKGAALAISVATSPVSQSIVAGGQGITFANYQFDASQSGEDVRFSSIPLVYDAGNNSLAANPNQLTSCQLWDGATAVNTGSNVVNPASTATSTTPALTQTFTFDSQWIVPKGSVKTLTLKCNVSSTADANSVFQWGLGAGANPTVTGVTSSNDVTETVTAASGPVMTNASGSLVVSTDSSSPSYGVVASGATGSTAGVFKFRATNEGVNLTRLGLKLTSGSASDLVSVSVWDGSTQVGTAVFTGSGSYATSTFNTPVSLPKDADKTLTVKVDTAMVGTSQPGTQGALVRIDFNGADSTGTQGTGVGSGNTINATGSTAVAGLRLFKSYPTLALDTLGSTGVADGRLMRFKVTANSAGSIGVSQFKFTIATTSASVSNVQLFAYTDASYSSPVSGQGTSGQVGSTIATWTYNTANTFAPANGSVAPVQVSAGSTVYFELKASVSGVTTGSSVVTTLLGDSAYTANLTPGFNVATSSAATSTGNFIWSGNATSTSGLFDVDWSNGYGLPGLSASGLIQTRSN